MAFKLEDNPSCSHIIQKRRVNELLTERIPPSEVILMSNGKLACAVCPHRPVLDTIPMLAVHRKGKKHLLYYKRFIDLESSQLPSKCTGDSRKTQMHRKLPNTAIFTNPYNPCCMKRKHTDTSQTRFQQPENSFVPPEESSPHDKVFIKQKHTAKVPTVIDKASFEKQKEIKRIVELRSQGWIKDRNGQWIKEDGVEFDSDEDEPCLDCS